MCLLYLMPLSIWDVLLTLASQRKIELDFAAITAKMSPSLSQSIPTQRLGGAAEYRESEKEIKLVSEQETPRVFWLDKTGVKNYVIKLTLEG